MINIIDSKQKGNKRDYTLKEGDVFRFYDGEWVYRMVVSTHCGYAVVNFKTGVTIYVTGDTLEEINEFYSDYDNVEIVETFEVTQTSEVRIRP